MITIEQCPECQHPDAECKHGIKDDFGYFRHLWKCPECGEFENIVLYECEECEWVKRGEGMKPTIGAGWKISESDLLFAARIVHAHLTSNRPAQAALEVQSHKQGLLALVSRLKMAAAYEAQGETGE